LLLKQFPYRLHYLIDEARQRIIILAIIHFATFATFPLYYFCYFLLQPADFMDEQNQSPVSLDLRYDRAAARGNPL